MLIIILQICYRAILSALALVNDFDFVYQVGYMFVGILGLSVHPFLYAVCLVEILRLDILKIVVKAFWNPIKEIAFVIILFVIIQYYFSLFGYMVLYDEYEDYQCRTLWRCYVTDFDQTFKISGALGSYLTKVYEERHPKASFHDDLPLYFTRFIFDTLFFLLLVLLIVNMLAGIIIDTY